MQTQLLMTLQISEDLYERDQNSKAALQLIYRYWLTACFIPDKHAAFLQKAYHTAVFNYKKDVANVELLLTIIFMNIELNQITAARELINNVSNAKPYFRANNQMAYTAFLYLTALVDFAEDKKRNVTKTFRQLESYYAETENISVKSLVAVMLASLSRKVYENNEVALTYFLEAQRMKARSHFLLVELYRFLSAYPTVENIEKPLILYLKWAVSHGAPITDFVYQFTPSMIACKQYWENDITFISSLYESCRLKWLLEFNAAARVAKKDVSAEALDVYKQAYEQGIQSVELNHYYVLSSFNNDIDSIPVDLAVMEIETGKHSDDVLCYLYHVLILNDDSDAVEQYEQDIMGNGSKWFTQRCAGKYYATVFIYILEKFQYDTNLCKAVFEQLFSYELTIDDRKLSQKIKYVWISEKEKKEMVTYPFENAAAYIRSASNNFEVFFLSAKQKSIITVPKYRIKKISSNYGNELLTRLFQKGFVSNDLLISFCNLFMDNGDLTEQAKQIMLQTLTVSGISDYFRSRVSLHLGHIFLQQSQIDKAYSYYNAASEKFMTSDDAAKLLKVYIQAGEAKKALSLLERKKTQLPDKIIFYTLKQIIQKDELKKSCANLSYELLMKSCYDKEFVDIVLGYYNGSLDNWIKLLDKLRMMGVEIEACYEAALKKGTMMYEFTDGLQKTFNSLYVKNQQNKWVERFVYYAASQIIPGHKKLEFIYETLQTMEKMFLQNTDNKILGYLLAHTYASKNTKTENTENIIRIVAGYIEEDRAYLPVFRTLQDKNFISSYMEMNLPFSYVAQPRRDIYLCYRFDEAVPYTKIKMRYFKFGLYLAAIPIFYNDIIYYCFEEDMLLSPVQIYEHSKMRFVEQYKSSYYNVYNALIYTHMFKYDKVEEIIETELQNRKNYVLQVL